MQAEELSPAEVQRYERQMILPGLGSAGQARIRAGSVLLIGAGGLGSPLALYLTAAGVGRIGIVESDHIDASNLQRQILYSTEEIGESKLERAAERLRALNPHVQIEAHPVRLSASNALEIFARYDVIADGSDNFPTRYLANDASILAGRPLVYGAIHQYEGQVSVFAHEGGPCYRCLVPEPPAPGAAPSCAEAGVLGVLPGVIGSLQATEALKLLAGIGRSLSGRLLLYDALGLRFREVSLQRSAECAACGDRPVIQELIDYEAFCGLAADAGNPADTPASVSVAELRRSLDEPGTAVHLLDVREPAERAVYAIQPSTGIPLSQLERRLQELPSDRDWIVYCKSGARSARATELLQGRGFARVRNLSGGVDAWLRANA